MKFLYKSNVLLLKKFLRMNNQLENSIFFSIEKQKSTQIKFDRSKKQKLLIFVESLSID